MTKEGLMGMSPSEAEPIMKDTSGMGGMLVQWFFSSCFRVIKTLENN